MSKLISCAKRVLRSTNVILSQQRYINAQQPNNDYDLIVVGGGIVGVTSAREMLERHPYLRIAIVEKESSLAVHQSGHTNGIVHTGVFFKPDSLNAKLCGEGYRLTCAYLDKKRIPHKKCGKLIVATHVNEVRHLMELYQNGMANGIPNLKLLHNEDEIREIEPFCRGIKALWSPETSIVDWVKVTENLASDFKANNGEIVLDFKVTKFSETNGDKAAEYPISLHGCLDSDILRTTNVLTCGGLQSDLIAKKTGCSREPLTIPLRSEQLLIAQEKQHMIKGIIYSVPKTSLSFLVPHFTPLMDESILYGPSTLLSPGRESYKWRDANIIELFSALRYPGFIKMVSQNCTIGFEEVRKFIYLYSQVDQFQKLIRELKISDIKRAQAGVEAHNVNPDGSLVKELVLHRSTGSSALSKRVIHCRNVPSPGATNSLAIAKRIADTIEIELDIGNKWCRKNTQTVLQ
uniref:L-2-hydroxyglutarate dehydrogenase, mitochondrial n=1 Tax=Glossina austeni TaxID=7395 RepID=A0A1A9VXR9_GLOAU